MVSWDSSNLFQRSNDLQSIVLVFLQETEEMISRCTTNV